MALLIATWPLWWVTSQPGSLPSLPLLDIVRKVDGQVASRIATFVMSGTLMAIGILGNYIKNAWRRKAWACVAICLTLLFALDQHRLQPWAYQSFFYAIIFAFAPTCQIARHWILVLMTSVYLYSSLGKFDYQFVHTVGHDFVLHMLKLPKDVLGVGWFDGLAVDEIATRLCFALPVTEFLAAVMLLPKRTQRFALVIVIFMHATLIGLLGPWSLGHSWGVVVWNVALLIQALIFLMTLHRNEMQDHVGIQPNDVPRPRSRLWSIARILIIVACVAPLAERAGYWDHWLSWSLYSPHTSGADIEIHQSVVDKLPEQTQRFVEDDQDGDGWHFVSLQRWSIETCWAPIYPQARYQIAVADDLARRYQIDRGIRVIERSASDRWTGQREQRWLVGNNEIAKRLRESWFYSF
ncbi:hypothetical protein Pla22_12180 [Rubripirellula amarantea]|uniref:Vitamin K-dependent gamma-carboxylase n=2 Tax=Rubripirellula amarantea TaxID=2527999 RepID=A0A5C5WTS3_9BACT|nr:hypothetical protein Pla22_12180 [Rubripirellula amarantea]